MSEPGDFFSGRGSNRARASRKIRIRHRFETTGDDLHRIYGGRKTRKLFSVSRSNVLEDMVHSEDNFQRRFKNGSTPDRRFFSKSGLASGSGSAVHARPGSLSEDLIRKTAQVVAVGGIILALIVGGEIFGFYHNSSQQGQTLISQITHEVNLARSNPALCASTNGSNSSSGSTGGVTAGALGSPGVLPSPADETSSPPAPSQASSLTAAGILKVSTIGLIAPVVQGTGDSQLNVAVGHDPSSVWPGSVGTSVLAAHDVTWFSSITALRPGEIIDYVERCSTIEYRISDAEVVSAGTPIFNTGVAKLTLVTCYPLDALFLTPQRYIVNATMVGQVQNNQENSANLVSTQVPSVPVPAVLNAQGLTIGTNPAPMGTLKVVGTPSSAWRQSSLPLNDLASTITLYFAALHSAEQGQSSWWSMFSPSVPFSANSALVGTTVVGNQSLFNPTLDVQGSQLVSVQLTTWPQLSGGPLAGTVEIQMTGSVVGSHLLLSQWSVQRG